MRWLCGTRRGVDWVESSFSWQLKDPFSKHSIFCLPGPPTLVSDPSLVSPFPMLHNPYLLSSYISNSLSACPIIPSNLMDRKNESCKVTVLLNYVLLVIALVFPDYSDKKRLERWFESQRNPTALQTRHLFKQFELNAKTNPLNSPLSRPPLETVPILESHLSSRLSLVQQQKPSTSSTWPILPQKPPTLNHSSSSKQSTSKSSTSFWRPYWVIDNA